MSRLILLFVGVPLLELVLLLQIGARIGAPLTVGLVITTGVLGAALARSQGVKAFQAVQEQLQTGQLPGQALLDGLAILVGGALLLTPGILTDVLGFTLLFPSTRGWIARALQRRLESRLREGTVQVRMMGPDGQFVDSAAELGTRARPPSEEGLGV